MLKFLGILFVILVVIIGTVTGLAIYGYGSVDVEFGGTTSLQPEYKVDLGSIAQAALKIGFGNWVGAAAEFVEGLTIRGVIDFSNDSVVPVWIPKLEHNLFIHDQEIGTPLETQSMWLGPHGHESVPVDTMIPLGDLPSLAVEYIYSGGELDMTMESVIRVGTISVSRTSSVTTGISSPVSSQGMVAALEWRNSTASSKVASVSGGTKVCLYVEARGCDGEELRAEIYEVDPLSPDDYVTTVFINIANGKGQTYWTPAWEGGDWGGLGGDPEYKFTVLGRDSNQLTVSQRVAPTPLPTPRRAITTSQWQNQTGSYSIAQVQEGTTVQLYVQAIGYDGQRLRADVYEVDAFSPDDHVTTIYLSVSNGIGRGYWTAVWQGDLWFGLGGDPEYKFTVLGHDSPTLTVAKVSAPTAAPPPTLPPAPTPPSMPTLPPDPPPSSMLTLTVNSILVQDDHEPFLKGAGEVYLILAMADGAGQTGVWKRVPADSDFSIVDGDTIYPAASISAPASPGGNLVYIGVWEEDHYACSHSEFSSRIGTGQSGFWSRLTTATANLSGCGDDLIGQLSDKLLAGSDRRFVGDARIDFTISE